MNLNELTEVCEPTLVVVPVTLEVVQNGWIDVCQEDTLCACPFTLAIKACSSPLPP